MNASVLIIGDSGFSARLYEQVRGLSIIKSWQVEGLDAALRLLESEVPDVILLQASQPGGWEFCEQIKQQRHLMWCYCLLLDEQPCPDLPASTDVLLHQAALTTAALEAGADAYIWMPSFPESESVVAAENLSRLLQAHFRSAARRNQIYTELSKTNDLLSSIALVDPLTQLANRRAFDWEMPRQIQVSREQKHPLSLLVLDIDHFKQVNDKHGHLVGDEVLRMFADRLRHHMRFYETPFRYGGEEFVIILQSTSHSEAHKLAERLRSLIDDTPFVVDQDLDLELTVSIGVGTLVASDDDKGEALIRRADGNLLKAKSTGRNRVITS